MNKNIVTEQSVENLKAFEATIFGTKIKDTALYRALVEYLVGISNDKLQTLSREIQEFEDTQTMGDTFMDFYYSMGDKLGNDCWYDSYNYEISNDAIHQLAEEYSR